MIPLADETTLALSEVCARIIDTATQLGMDQVECAIWQASGREIEVRNQAMESCESQQDQSIGMTVYQNRQCASIQMNDLHWPLLEKGIHSVCEAVRYMAADPCQGLADLDRMAKGCVDVDAYHPYEQATDDVVAQACRLESLAVAVDPDLLSCDGVSVGHYRQHQHYANSHGFNGGMSSTLYRMDCTMVADKNGLKQRDHDYTVARCIEDLIGVESLAQRVAERTCSRLGAKSIPSQRCPVVFSPEIARQLFGYLIAALSGRRLYQHRSFLCDRMGQSILPPWMGLKECPHQARGIGSAPFDAEGVATREQFFIEAGMIKQYILGSYAARRLGLQSTGNAGGVHNAVVVADASHRVDHPIAMMDRGLLITEVMGNGVELTSGRMSLGAFGYWVEGGQVVHPVEGVTIAADLLELFRSIEAMGNDVDRRGNLQVGSIVVPAITVAGS